MNSSIIQWPDKQPLLDQRFSTEAFTHQAKSTRRLPLFGILFSILISLTTACSTTNSVTKSSAATNNGATYNAAIKYKLLDDAPSGGYSRNFFLVKDPNGWVVSIENQDISKVNVEQFSFYPDMNAFSFSFSGKTKSRNAYHCLNKGNDRATYGYILCNSAFRKDSGLSTARVVANLMTLGMAELDNQITGVGMYEIDKENVTMIVNSFNISRLFNLTDYRTFYEKASNRNSLFEFINKYKEDDADGLVPKATEKLAVLDTNKTILSNAISSTPSKDDYIRKFTPSNSLRYCDDFKRDASTMAVCKTMVNDLVRQLATSKAEKTSRQSICTYVSSQVRKSSATDFCANYSQIRSCTAKNPDENKICDILTSKGQL